MPERQKLIIFNSIAVFGPALSYLVLSFAPTDRPWLSILAFMSTSVFFSTAGGGFYKCSTMCFRQFAHIVIASMQFTKALTMIIGPILVATFVKETENQKEWRVIFIGCAVMLILANITFCLVATDEPADFTKIDETVKEIEVKAPNPQRVQPAKA